MQKIEVVVRKRAGLADKTFAQSDLMLEIEHQCLLEFFGEGHRFDDLKRWYTTEEIKDIFTENEKQGAEYFQEKHKYYPIPSGELNNNDAMVQTELWRYYFYNQFILRIYEEDILIIICSIIPILRIFM